MGEDVPDDLHQAATPPLSPAQRTRVDIARADLQRIRALDLAVTDEWRLILLVERLRHRLDDVLAVLAEATEPPDTAKPHRW